MEVGPSLAPLLYYSAVKLYSKYFRKYTLCDITRDLISYIIILRLSMQYSELFLHLNRITVRGELLSSCNSSCQLLGSEARRSSYEQSWFGDGSVYLGVV